MNRRVALAGLFALLGGAAAWAGSIDTALMERPWPKQWVHDYEVGTSAVRWRQRASASEGLLAGAAFTAPSAPGRTWELATNYTELGPMTPGVSSVRIIEQTDIRRVIQIDMKVLWKDVRLVFEIEQEPPTAVRFRMANQALGEYRGVCRFHPEGQGTRVEITTWLKPAVHVPSRLVLWVQRSVMLKGIREFLNTCRPCLPAGRQAGPRG